MGSDSAALSIMAIVAMVWSTCARVIPSGTTAPTLYGNSSSTDVLMKSGEPSHHASASMGAAATRAVMMMRLRMRMAAPDVGRGLRDEQHFARREAAFQLTVRFRCVRQCE